MPGADEVKNNNTAGVNWIDYARWVGEALRQMRESTGSKISLFGSSVPEPSALLQDTLRTSFAADMPESYQSVFMRNHPVVERLLSERYALPAEAILCTTGATMGVSYTLSALCSIGEHVLIEHPGFDIFAKGAATNKLQYSFFERAAPDYQIVASDILQKLRPETRMVVITDLHNPSGALADPAELDVLATRLADRGIYLMIDEVYRDYSADPKTGVDVTRHENVVRIGSMTKVFGLNTLRCGWILASGKAMRALQAEFRDTDFNVSRLAHSIAAEVLLSAEQYDSWRDDMMASASVTAQRMLGEMEQSGLIRLGMDLQGCVCFPKVNGVDDTRALSTWLIDNHDVVVAPGECVGVAGHIRIGFGLPEDELSEGLHRLACGIAEYREKVALSHRMA